MSHLNVSHTQSEIKISNWTSLPPWIQSNNIGTAELGIITPVIL